MFDRQQPNTLGDLIVDILLDASASQNRRQEQLATQGYILAEALTRCAIPVRVLSYCSVSGCTVLREYRDYRENQGNNRIFEFAAAGWNRDGLALRAVDWLLRRSGEQQRLLLILTDANPNDDTRLPGTGNQVFSRDYSGRARRGRRCRRSDGIAQAWQSAAVPVLRPGGRFKQRPHHLRPGCGQAALRGLVCPDRGEDHSGTAAGS